MQSDIRALSLNGHSLSSLPISKWRHVERGRARALFLKPATPYHPASLITSALAPTEPLASAPNPSTATSVSSSSGRASRHQAVFASLPLGVSHPLEQPRVQEPAWPNPRPAG
jgi:hypothetical protein